MFCIKLAELNICVEARLTSTRYFCREYLSDEAPAFSVEITAQDIEEERVKAYRETAPSSVPSSGFQDFHLERQALLRKIADIVPQFGCMLVHGSAIMVDGKAYLFTAPSGTGKSTHARLWRELLGDRAVMINDDKPFVRRLNGEFLIYGSPWRGKHHLGENVSAPLAGICVLTQAPANSITRLGPVDALYVMLQQCYKPVDKASVLQTLTWIEGILADVPIYHLACNMDISSAELSYRTIVK